MGLREYLLREIKEVQSGLRERLTFSPVEDYVTYRQLIGEIHGLQRVIKMIEELPDE